MKGLVLHGAEDVRYEGIDDPEIADARDIIVQAKACGICGSDLHLYHQHGDFTEIGAGFSTAGKICVGHEAVGEVVEIGKAVTRHRVGDTVMLSGFVSCGRCAECLRGNSKMCRGGGWNVYGLGTGLGGCQSELIRVPGADHNAAALPEGVSIEQAILLTDNLPTAYCAVLNADIRSGRTVAVVGLGPIGLMVIELALMMGASVVYAIDLVPERRRRAAELGAVPVDGGDVVEVLAEATKGKMVDCVIEAVGSDRTVKLALDLVGIDGTVSILGVNNEMDFRIPPKAFFNNVTIRGNFATEITRYWQDLIALLQAGRISPERFITSRYNLSDGTAAYRQFSNNKAENLKTILFP
ncbi:MAG: hypothetical protein ABT11_18605 [Novosphingobium sp. SCN 66-18]|nr:MAG: hypothetical protein ABT11_18605 [Novosphingobium sp. SCN 66-18]